MPRTSSNNLGLQLVEYSPRTFRAAGKKAELVPFMLVSRTGRISFNRKAVELMGAGDGECAVTLLQDSRRPRDWYMRPGEGGFPLRGTKSYAGPATGTCGPVRAASRSGGPRAIGCSSIRPLRRRSWTRCRSPGRGSGSG